MAKLSFIKPLDQPPGTRRLLDDLKHALNDSRFGHFGLIVAYAKSGPLLRLRDLFEAWRSSGKRVEAVFGVDQQGTSKEALELALQLFDVVYVTQEAGITFHPKIYFFRGDSAARIFVGSNNLTVGGTEKNFELAVDVELELPSDHSILQTIEAAWTDLLPATCPATRLLDNALLAQLIRDNVVVSERAMNARLGRDDDANVGAAKLAQRTGLRVKPESPLPKQALRQVAGSRTGAARSGRQTPTRRPASPIPTPARGLAIQIKPHANGEIFLSVTAALQEPTFFGWPFTGKTTPKKRGNKSYPQLDPDPIVNVVVYGHGDRVVKRLPRYALNTVYYEKKKEIRITASPLVQVVPDYSVMIIERSQVADIDYEITIYRPDSPDYQSWVAACNQQMPSGGKKPRRFGWF